jgi:hypothetical protein
MQQTTRVGGITWGGRMRPAARWMSVMALLGAAGAPGLMAAGPAWADTAVSGVLASNWYWQEQDNVTPPGAPAGLPAGAPGEASGIPAGDFGVSYTNQVDKVTALNFDVSALRANAAVTRFAVTMPLDQGAHNLANGTPSLAACPAIDTFKSGVGPSPFSQVPPQGTSVCVDGKYDAAKQAFTFDIAQIAGDWAAGAPVNGIVVQPKPGDNTAFNYAFAGAKDITVAVSFNPPVTAPPVAPAPATGSGTGSGTGYVAAPPAGFTNSAPLTPVAPADAPLTAPAPQVMPPAAPVVAAPATAPVAATAPIVDALRPDGLFWLAVVAFGALLLLAALVLGDPLAPAVLDPRRRRFADVVRARAAVRATSAATSPAPTRSPGPRARPV